MRHVLLLTIIMTMAFTAVAKPQARTLKSEMEFIHHEYGVNFIYDSSLDLTIPYKGKDLADVSKTCRGQRNKGLEACLELLFADTGIRYHIEKQYVVLTLFVGERRDSIPESIITAYVERQYNSTQTGLHSIDFRHSGKSFAPLSSPDVIKEIKSLPGVSEGTELLSGMYVHGGDGSDNLFLLDGVPLYQVTHLGGLISSFNTEMIDNLDFYKSGFPARYGGRSSSVVDIFTRSGDMDSYHGSFNLGLLNGAIQLEGPIIPGKTSFNLGLRRSWFDVFTIPAMAIHNGTLPYGEKDRFRYAMTDLNASVAYLFNRDSKLSLNVYWGSDYVRYGHETLDVKYWEGVRHSGKNAHDLKTRWGNVLASLDWEKTFSDKLGLTTILYYTQVNAAVDLHNNKWGMDASLPAVNELSTMESNTSRLHDLALKADVDWKPSDIHHIKAGGSIIRHFFRQSKDAYAISRQVRAGTDETYYNTTFVHDRDSVRNDHDPFEAAIYIEDEISVAGWLKMNAGVRYAAFMTAQGFHHSVEPRAALRLQMGERTAFKLSYSEMSQFVHCLQANYLDIPMASWQPSTSLVLPSRSIQLAGGFYMTLPHNISFNVEGYWKEMDNLYEYCGISSIYPDISAWESELISGQGRSYGAEAELRWNNGKTELSAYYTLSWTERYFKGIWHDWYPARNDNRHKLTFNASHRFSKTFDMHIAWNYHTGDRVTVPTQIIDGELFYSHPYNHKLPDYHRLDVGFNFRKTTGKGNESIWNLSLYNAYCRMNPMFAMLDDYHMDDIPYAQLRIFSLIPIIPSFSYTLRF